MQVSISICVIHLVWAPLGETPLRRFLDSYRAHPAGHEHHLLVVYNGFAGEADPHLAACRRELEEVEHDELVLTGAMLDLEGYRLAAEHIAAERVCMLNSYSRVCCTGWLDLLARAVSVPDMGMVGASGSYESTYSAAPPWRRPRLRREFPPFPNPHLRTNAFLVRRQTLLSLYREPIRTKRAALALENGRHSMTRQLVARGLGVRVVGKDGRVFAPGQWPASGGFRSGAQDNLLVADNRTDQYRDAGPRLRRVLARKAWGVAARGNDG